MPKWKPAVPSGPRDILLQKASEGPVDSWAREALEELTKGPPRKDVLRVLELYFDDLFCTHNAQLYGGFGSTLKRWEELREKMERARTDGRLRPEVEQIVEKLGACDGENELLPLLAEHFDIVFGPQSYGNVHREQPPASELSTPAAPPTDMPPQENLGLIAVRDGLNLVRTNFQQVTGFTEQVSGQEIYDLLSSGEIPGLESWKDLQTDLEKGQFISRNVVAITIALINKRRG